MACPHLLTLGSCSRCCPSHTPHSRRRGLPLQSGLLPGRALQVRLSLRGKECSCPALPSAGPRLPTNTMRTPCASALSFPRGCSALLLCALCVHACSLSAYVSVCMCMRVCACLGVHLRAGAYFNVHVYVCICMRAGMCMHVCVRPGSYLRASAHSSCNPGRTPQHCVIVHWGARPETLQAGPVWEHSSQARTHTQP